MIFLSAFLSIAVLALPIGSFAAEQQNSDADLVVSIKTTGGLCPYGDCSDEVKIFKNNSYLIIDGEGRKKSGRLDHGQLVALIDVMEKTDFSVIKSQRFMEQCPSNYDGAQVVYHFYTLHGVEDVDSCQHQIDENQPVFKTLSSSLEPIL